MRIILQVRTGPSWGMRLLTRTLQHRCAIDHMTSPARNNRKHYGNSGLKRHTKSA